MKSDFDARTLERELRQEIEGEVRFDDGSRALYATDASNYRQVPIGVVVPKSKQDVEVTVGLCRKHRVPILSRGGGTSLAGQCCNVAIVMDFSKYLNHIVEFNPSEKYASVEPGIVLDRVREETETKRLTFAPDPATHNHCTLGGMIGNNSCGVHSVMAGKTSENILELEILTYGGDRLRVGRATEEELAEIIRVGGIKGSIYSRLRDLRDRYADQIRKRYPKIPRRVSGYNLDELLPENGFNVAAALVGTESTCVTILEAKLRLVPSPSERVLVVAGYRDIYEAGDHVPEILRFSPIGLEGIDHRLVQFEIEKDLNKKGIALLPPGKGFLIIEFGAYTHLDALTQAQKMIQEISKHPDAPHFVLLENTEQQKLIWDVRESGLGATAWVKNRADTWEGWEDSAVPPDKVGAYLRDLRALLERHGYGCALYGHFGQGCIHTRIDFDFSSHAGLENYRSFMDSATDLVLSYGGSLSGEHGDGQSRARYLPKMFGPELIGAFTEFKAIWDPDGQMNPGKIINPYDITDNLRVGPSHNPPTLSTHFQFPDDRFHFARAALRCVGVGECRRMEKGTMCPSYRVTMEEQHSTRGRARLLFEMLEGEVIKDRWQSNAVKEALDLCLACKGCKGDCPVKVDMATYKAEFYSHHYHHRLRPRHAYAMGFINVWAGLASKFPRLVNALAEAPVFGRLFKFAGGISQDRQVPKFATTTLRHWFKNRDRRSPPHPGRRVLLWPDTFNNYFHPEIGQAAVEVLEKMGFQVEIPRKLLCCGRPLYDFGFLTQAKEYLTKILEELRPEIRAGIPLVALEPSCLAVFRDELVNLFPNDLDAQRLSHQALSLAEFVEQFAQDFEFPRLNRQAYVHRHCHDLAVIQSPIAGLLRKMGVVAEIPDNGCCGMAGSFGFESEHYDISQKIGESKLLPALKNLGSERWIIADGFSCHEQIRQGSGRSPFHSAQVLAESLAQLNKEDT